MCIFLYGAAVFYNAATEEFVVIVKQIQVNHAHSIQSSNSNNSNSNNSKNNSKNNRSFLIFFPTCPCAVVILLRPAAEWFSLGIPSSPGGIRCCCCCWTWWCWWCTAVGWSCCSLPPPAPGPGLRDPPGGPPGPPPGCFPDIFYRVSSLGRFSGDGNVEVTTVSFGVRSFTIVHAEVAADAFV